MLLHAPFAHTVIVFSILHDILDLKNAIELIQYRFLGTNDELHAIVDDFQISISYEYLWG